MTKLQLDAMAKWHTQSTVRPVADVGEHLSAEQGRGEAACPLAKISGAFAPSRFASLVDKSTDATSQRAANQRRKPNEP